MNKLHLASALAMGLALSHTAAAEATATASITGFSYTLIDLDLTDGVTPAITFSNQYSSTNAQSGDLYASNFGPDANWFSPNQASVTSAVGSGSGTVTTTGAIATSTTFGTGSPGFNEFGFGVAYPVIANFAVTPSTGIIFQTSFAGTATTTAGRVGDTYEYAVASGYVYLDISQPNGGQTFNGYRSVGASYRQTGDVFTGETQSFAGTVELSYANLSAAQANGFLYAYAYTTTQSSIPVPEPEAWLLMASGLLGIRLLARRRSA